jgi:hypothetical protein
MKMLWLVLPVSSLCGQSGPPIPTEPIALAESASAFAEESAPLNVNARYTVESAQVIGWRVKRLSDGLRAKIDGLSGEKFDHSRVEALRQAIGQELHVPGVTTKVSKGAVPDNVVVTFEVPRSHEQDVDFNIARFLYDSRTGFTGEAGATTYFHGNAFSFGLVSDGDTQLERFAGIRAGFERRNLWYDRLGVRFSFASYHDQWNAATISSSPDEIYRTREVYEPEAMLALTSALELDFGVRISRYRLAAPVANTESSNAVVSTLRYHQRWGSEEEVQQEALASYDLTAATKMLASDPLYTRNMMNATYRVKRRHNSLEFLFLAGKITGVAPLFDRFVLGNASTLRGWSKFALDPLGGSRVVHGSINYVYRKFQAFYDAGAIWDRPQDREAKQSAGVGLKANRCQLAVAFPFRSGHVDPVFYAGMNF